METRRERAEAIARRYIGVQDLFKDLGSGAEGFVFPSPSATAIKVFSYAEKFERELAAYQRLAEWNVIDVCGLAVPRLVDFDRDLLVIEMTMVQRPFLLDFAQARLDEPLEFPESEDEMWARLAEDFCPRLPDVQEIYYFLQNRYGIFYYDLAPRNIDFGDDLKK